MVSNGQMIEELGRIRKEAIMAQSRYYLDIYLEGVKKIMKTLSQERLFKLDTILIEVRHVTSELHLLGNNNVIVTINI
jgi:hypothetical protein